MKDGTVPAGNGGQGGRYRLCPAGDTGVSEL